MDASTTTQPGSLINRYAPITYLVLLLIMYNGHLQASTACNDGSLGFVGELLAPNTHQLKSVINDVIKIFNPAQVRLLIYVPNMSMTKELVAEFVDFTLFIRTVLHSAIIGLITFTTKIKFNRPKKYRRS